MQLYYIRHAQSANNAAWDRLGTNRSRSEDPELTELGVRQAELLAQYLAQADAGAAAGDRDIQNRRGFGITHLYTSLMVRSVATGAHLSRAIGAPLVAWDDIHEGGGIYLDDEELNARLGQPGKNRAYFIRHYPDLVLPEALYDAGWWNRPFEEREQRYGRARRVVERLRARHGGTQDRVAIVSHGGFFNYLLCVLFNLAARDGFWFVLNNASISRFDFDWDEQDVGIVYLNRVDFLPSDMIS